MIDENPQSFTEPRFKDVNSARAIYSKLSADHEDRRKVYTKLRNQLEGGQPYDPVELESMGEAWRTNHNFGDAAASKERTLLPYWEIVHNTPRMLTTTIHSNSPQAEKWQQIVEEEFDTYVDRWGMDYQIQYRALVEDYVTFGLGGCVWPDKDSPRWEHINYIDFLFPKETSLSPDKWPLLMVRRSFTISELWEKVRDESTAEEAGWNTGAVREALLRAKAGESLEHTHDEWMRLQDELVNNDLTVSTTSELIKVVYAYTRQWDGKVSCHIFTETALGEADNYLFEDLKYAESFREVVGMIFWEVSNKQVHGVKGFASRNYGFSVLINRMKCRLVDASTLVMGLNFERTASVESEAPPMENYGAINVFPQGLRQIPVYPTGDAAFRVLDMLDSNQSENNALYREQGKQIQETDTATQAEILAGLQSQVSQAQSSLYLAQVGEAIYQECFRRLRAKSSDKDAKAFREAVLERGADCGLTEEIFDELQITVKMAATASTGNPATRQLMWKELLGLMNVPGFNQRWIKENYVANRVGGWAVKKALLPEGVDQNANASRWAIVENLAMGDMTPMPVAAEDDHVVHMETHLQPLEQAVGMYQQSGQMKPEHFMTGNLVIQHMQQHLEFLSRDDTKKQALRELGRRFAAVGSVYEGVARKIQKEGQQQNAQMVQQTQG